MALLVPASCPLCGIVGVHQRGECEKNQNDFDQFDAKAVFLWIDKVSVHFGRPIPGLPTQHDVKTVSDALRSGETMVYIMDVMQNQNLTDLTVHNHGVHDEDWMNRNHVLASNPIVLNGLDPYDEADAVQGKATRQQLATLSSLWAKREDLHLRGLFHSTVAEDCFDDLIRSRWATRGRAVFERVKRDNLKLLTFSYVYLLLDVTKLMEGNGSFEAFLAAIIYIGRGTGPRAEDHLVKAKKEQDKNGSAGFFLASRKLSIINYLWYMRREVGVVVSQFNVPSVVADTVEHAMIETVGLAELTNKIPGNTSRYRLNNPDELFELGIYQLDQFYREHGDPSAATIPTITRHQVIMLREIH